MNIEHKSLSIASLVSADGKQSRSRVISVCSDASHATSASTKDEAQKLKEGRENNV